MDDLILGHCPRRNPCRFCREHLARAEARRLDAHAPPGTFWESKTWAGIDQLGYWPPGGPGGGAVTYLKTPRPVDHPAGRRKIRPMLAYGQRRPRP